MTRTVTTLPFTELPVAVGNFDTSRTQIDRIIIHTMVGTWQAAAARFNNPAEKVSAHYGVRYDGTLIHWLEETSTGYHAGNYSMNQRSIGIEHEDLGKYNDSRPDVLYIESAKLVADICKFYNIPCDSQHILKHSEVVATGCPDSLDVNRIIDGASKLGGIISTMNDQTIISKDLLGWTEDLEIQAIRGKLSDLVKAQTDNANLKISITALNDQITALQAKYDELASQPQTPPPSGLQEPVFKYRLSRYLYSLAKNLG